MAKKYKMTGCARFLIFFLVFAPLVYFGVSYLRGENPIEPIKNAIPESWGKSNSNSSVSEDAILNGKIDAMEERIKSLEQENKDLREIIEARDAEIKGLRN